MSDYIRPDEWSDEDPVKELPILKRFSDIENEAVDWLVYDFIPRGEITVIGADGGVGKSSFVTKLLADLSAGRETVFDVCHRKEAIMNGYKIEPKTILFFSGEDSGKKILRPKLELCNADFSRAFFMDAEDPYFKDLTLGSDFFINAVAECKPDLLVLDPLQSFYPENRSMSERNSMRHCLDSLSYIGGKFGTSTLVVAHANKGNGNYGRKRLADSSDLWDKARSVFLCGRTGNEPGDGEFYISQEKNNYARLQQTLLYDVEEGRLQIGEKVCTYGVIHPRRWSDKKDRDYVLLQASGKDNKPQIKAVEDYIIDILKQEGGQMTGKELEIAIEEGVGASKYALRNARANLSKAGKISIRKIPGQGGKWVCSLST